VNKTELKGLARIIGPLSIWMSLGWALHPYLIEKIALSMGETLVMSEVELFSMIMFIACLVVGIILLAYGFIGRRASQAEAHFAPGTDNNQ
jgi:hypothetical protein